MINYLVHLDTRLFLFLNGLDFSLLNPVMIIFSKNLTWIPFFLVFVIYMYKRFGCLSVWPLSGLVLVVILADQASIHLFKNVFERLRPCHNPEIMDIIQFASGECRETYSFVSSHAAISFGVAIFLSMLFKVRWFTFSIYIWASLVSYSRIYLGLHYPADILAGAFLGALCGYGVGNFSLFLIKQNK
jgi:undecaprenyl-diphosphatase